MLVEVHELHRVELVTGNGCGVGRVSGQDRQKTSELLSGFRYSVLISLFSPPPVPTSIFAF